jgi:hypothetical protein
LLTPTNNDTSVSHSPSLLASVLITATGSAGRDSIVHGGVHRARRSPTNGNHRPSELDSACCKSLGPARLMIADSSAPLALHCAAANTVGCGGFSVVGKRGKRKRGKRALLFAAACGWRWASLRFIAAQRHQPVGRLCCGSLNVISCGRQLGPAPAQIRTSLQRDRLCGGPQPQLIPSAWLVPPAFGGDIQGPQRILPRLPGSQRPHIRRCVPMTRSQSGRMIDRSSVHLALPLAFQRRSFGLPTAF